MKQSQKGIASSRHLSMKSKLTLSLAAIAVTLLISSVISVMEYRSMSDYVTSLIADNISSINAARQLADDVNSYNLKVLAAIGEENYSGVPKFDSEAYLSRCDSLKSSFEANSIAPLADSVVYAYSAYMLTSLELEDVLQSDFIDSRQWFFGRLQPGFNQLQDKIECLSSAIHADLEKNSASFQRGFYRSIIPGIVAVGVGLLLVLMLLFFILAYYVNPIYHMLEGLDGYRKLNKTYSCTFDGDDQLDQLNAGITEITSENAQLRRRISALRSGIVKGDAK